MADSAVTELQGLVSTLQQQLAQQALAMKTAEERFATLQAELMAAKTGATVAPVVVLTAGSVDLTGTTCGMKQEDLEAEQRLCAKGKGLGKGGRTMDDMLAGSSI